MFQKVKKEYQILAAVILILFVALGYIIMSSQEDLSVHLNDNAKASVQEDGVVISEVKVANITGNAQNGVGPSYNEDTISFDSVLFGALDEITYEVTYVNMGNQDKILTKAELIPDVNDGRAMTYGIGNVKENDTTIKSGETLTVLVNAKVNEGVTTLSVPNKSFQVSLTWENK